MTTEKKDYTQHTIKVSRQKIDIRTVCIIEVENFYYKVEKKKRYDIEYENFLVVLEKVRTSCELYSRRDFVFLH